MRVESVSIDAVIPYARNPRKNDEAASKVAASIKEYGWQQPIVVDAEMVVIAGHTRLLAAQRLGLKEVPIVVADSLSPAQVKAYRLADNRVAQESEWDNDLLALELTDLKELDFNLELTGFEDGEIDALLQTEVEGLTDPDEVPEPPADPIAVRGDIWTLGNHRLMCGDSTSINDVDALMDGQLADLLHTDPPYNVAYSNAARPKAGKTDLGEIKNDCMDGVEFYEFLRSALTCAYAAMKADSSAYVWHASSEHVNFTNALIDSGFKYTQQIIWKKPMLLGRGRYQWAHEPCLLGVKGSPFFTDDRTKTTVWDFGGYDKSKNMHPTQKPSFIPVEAITNSSKEGSLVLDLFGGSGSTLLACEALSRSGLIMELDEKYVDVIITRWQNFTGKEATLNGKTYSELRDERQKASPNKP